MALLVAMASSASAQTRLVIVSGLGGAPKYTKEFADLANTMANAAKERAGLQDSSIAWYGDPAAPRSKWFRGPSLKDTLESVLARLAQRPINEQLVLVLIGHGSGEAEDTKISLPGPDLAARDFKRMLASFGARRVAFVNLTSASGDMMGVLAAPGRVVITATKSAFERNESHFGEFFITAFAKDGADTDKDNRVSLLEAFAYAEAETKRLYDADSRMLTEHSQIADVSGVAKQFFLTPGALHHGAADARLTALYNDRAALDDSIQALKAKKTTMAGDAYESALERLMIALAQNAQEIRKLEKGS
ncbi:MAG TPA: hypothetical protein VF483_07250 [Gemmatimonadaceae bacterium]